MRMNVRARKRSEKFNLMTDAMKSMSYMDDSDDSGDSGEGADAA